MLVRRLHDINKSGWYILVGLIPIIGWVIMLVWLCQDSEVTTNRFGDSPKYGNSSVQYERDGKTASSPLWILGIALFSSAVLLIALLEKNNIDIEGLDSFITEETTYEDETEKIPNNQELVENEQKDEFIDQDIVNDAYVQVLNDISQTNVYCDYFLFDITKDGTPELWVTVGSCEADYALYVYTYDNGAKQIYETGAGHSSFFSGSDYIIQVCAHMGYSSWYKITYDGKMKEEEVFTEDINGTDEDYSVPSEDGVEFISFK